MCHEILDETISVHVVEKKRQTRDILTSGLDKLAEGLVQLERE
jgi:hypothetical protein